MIASATVVAVTEGTHGAAEPLEFRNRLLQYLVEKHGFTAIAIESGLVEGRTVHDYVRGGAGDLSTVLSRGITWSFDELPVNRSLVSWLRQYNADARHARKINFYGFDVPGSPGNPYVNRGPDTALTEALQYLMRVDRTAAANFQRRLERLIKNIRFDPALTPEGPTYERLAQAERDALTAGLGRAIAASGHVPATPLRREAGQHRQSDRQGRSGVRGKRCCDGTKRKLEPALADSLEGLAGQVGKPLYLLDLRAAPPPVAAWLGQEQWIGRAVEKFRLAPGRAFDVVLYTETVTPTCSAAAVMH